MYSVDAEKREERGGGDEEGQSEGGSREGRGSRKGGELEAMCVLMLCSFLK